MMKYFMLISLLSVCSMASAAGYQLDHCKADLDSMDGAAGIVVTVPACGTQKICEIISTCTWYDPVMIAKYGSISQVPELLINEARLITSGVTTCLTVDDHCPTIEACKADEGALPEWDRNRFESTNPSNPTGATK